MKKTFAIAGILAAAGASTASMLSTDQSLVLDQNGSVSITFESSSAGATGHLYFLGFERDGLLTAATSSDEQGLGQFLFSNKGGDTGNPIALGSFEAGDVLHFAYAITKGSSGAVTGDVLRTDDAGSDLYFGLGEVEARGTDGWARTLAVEDIRVENNSDLDYNDAVFTVEFHPIPVPTPGTIALAAMASGLLITRRR